MKRASIICLVLVLAAGMIGCAVQPVSPPQSKIITVTPEIPDSCSRLAAAYIQATDLAIKMATDAYRSTAPEFLSFGFGTTFALKQSERDLFVKAFEVYGIPLDTRGTNPPARTTEEMSKGFVLLFPTGSKHKAPDADLTVTVEVCYQNRGYVYYFDFDLSGNQYVMIQYLAGYEEINPI